MAAGYGPWIDWAGGKKSPLPDGTPHQVRFRDLEIVTDDSPETWDWSHQCGKSNIVAYRVRKVR